jgi:hypothetical protein
MADGAAIRPLRIEVPQEEIDELRRRVRATRRPEKETVADQSQGVQPATMRALARYSVTGRDAPREAPGAFADAVLDSGRAT